MNIRKEAKSAEKELKIDEIDKNVIRALLMDPRVSLRDLAAITRNSVGTVRERISRLQKAGVIKGYSAIIDPSKVGYKITAIIEVFESKKGLGIVEEDIRGMPNVFGVYSVTGSTDVVILARFRDSEELNDFVRKILRIKNVSRTETLIVLDTYKEDMRAVI